MTAEARRRWHTVRGVEGNCWSEEALAGCPSLSLSRANYDIYVIIAIL